MVLRISYDRHITVSVNVFDDTGEKEYYIGAHRRSGTNTYDHESENSVDDGTVYNHEGTDLELLEKILHGRNMSGKTTT